MESDQVERPGAWVDELHGALAASAPEGTSPEAILLARIVLAHRDYAEGDPVGILRAALAEAEKRGEARGFAEGIKAAEGVAREMRADIVVRAGRAQKQGATQIAQRLEVHADHVHSVEKKIAALAPESTPRLYTEEEVAERVRGERERCLRLAQRGQRIWIERAERPRLGREEAARREGVARGYEEMCDALTSGEEP